MAERFELDLKNSMPIALSSSMPKESRMARARQVGWEKGPTLFPANCDVSSASTLWLWEYGAYTPYFKLSRTSRWIEAQYRAHSLAGHEFIHLPTKAKRESIFLPNSLGSILPADTGGFLRLFQHKRMLSRATVDSGVTYRSDQCCSQLTYWHARFLRHYTSLVEQENREWQRRVDAAGSLAYIRFCSS